MYFSTNESFTKAQGCWGGSPGSLARIWVRNGANVSTHTMAGGVPQDIEQLAGANASIEFKPLAYPVVLSGDVWGMTHATLAGWGDPLIRDPDDVAADVAAGVLTSEMALSVYGVVLRDRESDIAATTILRQHMRDNRLGRSIRRAPASVHSVGRHQLGDFLFQR